jgi:membrane protease YdiL (CAAX protease family)
VKEIGKILTYLAAVLFCGAILAPGLYWAAHALADAGVLVVLRKYPFQKYFNRSLLLCAIALLWPCARWLGVSGKINPTLEPDRHWKQHLGQGLFLGAGVMALLSVLYLKTGFYVLKTPLSAKILGFALASAVSVGFLEEWLFRGAIAGLLLRSLPARAALMWTSGIFAVVHFLKPNPAVSIQAVGAWTGFTLVPHMFHQFAQPLLLLAGFTTLFVFGWTLGVAALRTRALWMSIGIHAGLVFIKAVFGKVATRQGESLPWVGPELQIGLVPVGLLLVALALVWLWTANHAQHNTVRSA